jgi:hypothetical protein
MNRSVLIVGTVRWSAKLLYGYSSMLDLNYVARPNEGEKALRKLKD